MESEFSREMKARRQEVLRSLFGDFKWPSRARWLLPHHSARHLGIDLARATAELEKLYPPDVCEAIVGAGDEQLVSGLFYGDGWHDGVSMVLFLGDDLANCPGWERTSLRKRLRDGDQFDGARFEVGVWSCLVRAGLAPVFEESKAGADFRFVDGGTRIMLETKAVEDARLERNQHIVKDVVGFAVTAARPASSPTVDVWVELDPVLVRDAEDLPPEDFSRKHARWIRAAVATALWFPRWDADGAARAVMTGVGSIRVAPSASASSYTIHVEGIDEQTPAKRVARALRPAMDAAKQLASAADDEVRVAVVWVSRATPAEYAIENLGEQIERRPKNFAGIDHVVLLNSSRTSRGWCTQTAIHSLPGARGDLATMTWPEALKRWRLCQ